MGDKQPEIPLVSPRYERLVEDLILARDPHAVADVMSLLRDLQAARRELAVEKAKPRPKTPVSTDDLLNRAGEAVYVNTGSGDDVHDGMSPETAVKTLARANQIAGTPLAGGIVQSPFPKIAEPFNPPPMVLPRRDKHGQQYFAREDLEKAKAAAQKREPNPIPTFTRGQNIVWIGHDGVWESGEVLEDAYPHNYAVIVERHRDTKRVIVGPSQVQHIEPCPFCGSDATVYIGDGEWIEGGCMYSDCAARLDGVETKTLRIYVEAWNRRVKTEAETP